jgi:23S rRNA pseudouridine955/2504/2580 synthase
MTKKRAFFDEFIIQEDEDYIFINKPSGISTLDDRNSLTNILVLARDYHENAQVCHRLDKETSGVMAIVKNDSAYKHFESLLRKREVHKEYHAIIGGSFPVEEIIVDKPLAITGRGVVKVDYKKGKASLTHFQRLKAFKGFSMVQCIPVTGRMHQIRVHLSSIGFPITNDEKYGGSKLYLSSLKRNYKRHTERHESPLIQRIALHAFSVRYTGITGKEVQIEAGYPKDLNILLKQLNKYAGV